MCIYLFWGPCKVLVTVYVCGPAVNSPHNLARDRNYNFHFDALCVTAVAPNTVTGTSDTCRYAYRQRVLCGRIVSKVSNLSADFLYHSDTGKRFQKFESHVL